MAAKRGAKPPRTVDDFFALATNDYRALERAATAMVDSPSFKLLDVPLARATRGSPMGSQTERDQQRLYSDTVNATRGRPLGLSVIVPCFGNKTRLLECLDSIARQSLLDLAPRTVELIVVQDGGANSAQPGVYHYDIDPLEDPEDIRVELTKFGNKLARVKLLKLSRNTERSAARNFGADAATREHLVFVDSSMVLDIHFLSDIMLRARIARGAALLGFKETLYADRHGLIRPDIRAGRVRPDYTKDWRISRKYADSEEQFRFDGRVVRRRTVEWMKMTNWLRNAAATTGSSFSGIASCVQTNLFAIAADKFRELGGFQTAFDGTWGLEDTFFGKLILASGIPIVPVPSACAFKIEHPEPPTEERRREVARQKKTYQLLSRRPLQTFGPDQLTRTDNPVVVLEVSPKSLSAASIPRRSATFDFSNKSKRAFEESLIGLLQYCVEKDAYFWTLAQDVPFFARHLWVQQAIQHRKWKSSGQSRRNDFFLLRRRYDLWEALLARKRVRLILDKEGLGDMLRKSLELLRTPVIGNDLSASALTIGYSRLTQLQTCRHFLALDHFEVAFSPHPFRTTRFFGTPHLLEFYFRPDDIGLPSPLEKKGAFHKAYARRNPKFEDELMSIWQEANRNSQLHKKAVLRWFDRAIKELEDAQGAQTSG